MTRLCATFLFLFSGSLWAQPVLEHTYSNAGFFSGLGQLYMVDFEIAGMKYIRVDRSARVVTLYNLDHSLFQSVSYASMPLPDPVAVPSALYFSEHLFDQDDEIEFMVTVSWPNQNATRIYNFDGSVLFDAPGEAPLVLGTYHNQHFPIYSTPEGTKLIMSKQDGTARVYGLPGQLTVGLSQLDWESMDQAMMFYPNPTEREVTIDMGWPVGSSSRLAFTDVGGRVIHEMALRDGDRIIKIDVHNWSSGTYFITYINANTASALGKLIVAH